ncbi:MAG: hypothetical protein ACYTBJ_04815, partial [Planctomycetota bacterium]
MKQNNDNLEKNISRLVKRAGGPLEPSKAFTDALTNDALAELAGSGKDRKRERKDKTMKVKWSKILAYSAAVI